ncbi:MAG: cytochrome c [Gallionella sp.]
MQKMSLLMLLCLSTGAFANPFPTGNAKEGEALFDKHKCNSCHAAMLGGDGNAMFTRTNRKVTTPAQMLGQITQCSGNVGVKLSPQEEQHLAAYLNKYYKLK